MAARKIVIRQCSQCPKRDHKGGFGSIAYIPICRATNKELPYTVHKGSSKPISNMVMANALDVIPDWCPLEINND